MENLLDKTRAISKLNSTCCGQTVDFEEMAKVLSEKKLNLIVIL